jgi:hypothetical protein
MPVSAVQRGRGRREGGPGSFFPLLPCLTAWVEAEGAGARPRGSLEHGYRAGAKVNSVGHSDFDFLDFCPPGVRHDARKKLKFKILKIFTLGGQHIRQGFQRYFCSEEISCFAKI